MANNYRKRYKSKPNPRPQHQVEGDKTTLALPIEKLNLNEDTYNLLKGSNFNTIYDIACNTEREMYRVQSFNKKHLLHTKSKLVEKGLDFVKFEEIKKPINEDDNNNKNAVAKKPNEKAGNPKNDKVLNNKGFKQTGKMQNTNENKNPNRIKNKNVQNNRNQQNKGIPAQQREKRPRVELPIEQWRKISKGGKWGFNNGLRTVISPQFDEVFSFKNGLACVEIDEKFGYIDPKGEVVIPIEYECAMSFSEEMAVVFENCKAGYIDKENKKIIECKYDAATTFENGRAKVKLDGKWGTISPDGTLLWSK